ncbi:MAG: DUF2165 family protein [Pseudomonadota bacterium]
METVEVAVQVVLVSLLAGWLVVGAYENIRAPEVNLDLMRDVFSMRSLSEEAPELYELLKRNRITAPNIQELLFRIVVVFETIVATILVIAAFMLGLALFGLLNLEIARILGVFGALGFTMIWGAFLVGGNWFHYWIAHKSTQHTHYFMTIWGIVTLAVLL